MIRSNHFNEDISCCRFVQPAVDDNKRHVTYNIAPSSAVRRR
jgi:hypothetical protein